MDINNRVRLDVPSMAFPVFSLKDEDPNYIEVGDFAKIYNHDFYDDEFMVRITRIELPFYITGVIPLRDDEFPFTVKNIRVLIKRRQAEKNGGYENQSLPLFNAGAYRWISTFEKFKTLGFIQNEWPDTLVLRRKNVDLSVVYGLDVRLGSTVSLMGTIPQGMSIKSLHKEFPTKFISEKAWEFGFSYLVGMTINEFLELTKES